jgi:AmmeMemoRadiSam system protein A
MPALPSTRAEPAPGQGPGEEHDARLLDAARSSILESLRIGRPAALPQAAWPPPLVEPGASFVTLSCDGALRGCCGSLEAHQPLVADVWMNAQRTAFGDPRFAPLAAREVPGLYLEISLLGPLSPFPVDSEAALLEALRPGVDGLLITLGERRATFLPKVWETLPEPREFLCHLRHKLGVRPDAWDERFRFQRYRTRQFGGALERPAHGVA